MVSKEEIEAAYGGPYVEWAIHQLEQRMVHVTARREWDELKRLAYLGAALELLPHLMRVPDDQENFPDFVQLGVDDDGLWSITRWKECETFDEDGPISTGNGPFVVLENAIACAQKDRVEAAAKCVCGASIETISRRNLEDWMEFHEGCDE